jgi:parallel beta-helix repeat protein
VCITAWPGVMVITHGAMNNTVKGNYIGTDVSGTSALPNCHAVDIRREASYNVISDNLISGNEGIGVTIRRDAMHNTIIGNKIGTDVNGTSALPNNQGFWIAQGAHDNVIGGDTPGERNIISGNRTCGVCIGGGSDPSWDATMNNIVGGNYIGTDISGTSPIGNVESGVAIGQWAQDNVIGAGNVIAHNGDDGVTVDGASSTGNTITQNSIFSNDDMGIDLTDDANGNIAAPVIFTTTLGSVNIVGTACPDCTVEVFENGDTDGEGETYVGDTTATASGAFTVTVSYLTKPYLTATATDAISGTSEFSAVFTATVPLAPPVSPIYLPIILKNY